MTDQLTLNLTLPPTMYEAATSQEALAPPVSMTYTPADFTRTYIAKQSEFGEHMENINRAAMSGRPALNDMMISKANQFVNAYHDNVVKRYAPKTSEQPILGSERSMSLKTAIEKMKRG